MKLEIRIGSYAYRNLNRLKEAGISPAELKEICKMHTHYGESLVQLYGAFLNGETKDEKGGVEQ